MIEQMPTMEYIKFTYWDTYDLEDVLYQTGFKNEIYFPVLLNLPEDVLEKDGDYRGTLFVSRREVLKEIYSISCSVPQYVLEALYFAQLHDNIWITFENGISKQVYDFAVGREIEGGGGIARVTLTFRTNSIEKTNCRSNMSIVTMT